MSNKTELIIEFTDLRIISIPCRKCETRIRLDCTDQEANIPEECPGCHKAYPDSFRTSLHSFRQLYRKLADEKGKQVEVCVPRSSYSI